MSLYWQVMKDLHENRIQVYTGEMDEEDDSPEMKQLKVSVVSITAILLKGGAYSKRNLRSVVIAL